jgi:6-phosphogluconate dehydrogenase
MALDVKSYKKNFSCDVKSLQLTMNKYNFDTQAQRDYFGAHTYELLSAPGHYVHTNWTGTGGNVSASTYSA